MWDFIHNHKKFIQILLAIMFLPFAFFGMDSYFRSSDRGSSVATVGGLPISQFEFAQALRERQEQVQRMTGGRMDPALLESPELRFAVLEGIIRQRLLINEGVRNGVMVPDQQLQQLISEQEAFQEDGRFSNTRYEAALRRQNMTPVSFENGLRRDLILERVSDAYRSTAIVPKTVAERLLRLTAQQREVSQIVFEPEKFLAQAKADPAAAKQYYDSHQAEFQIPERARIEYLVLSLDAVASQADAGPDEVKQFYEQNLGQYSKGDERQASHILITVDPQASAEVKQAAKAKAEMLLKQVRQKPASFAGLAKQHSQDPGSAAQGGDLGYFPRGAMIKPFDDAVFQMKQGEIAGPVESTFGYHIIQLTGVKGRGFDDVRKQVESDLKRQKAGKRFSELAEQFNNQVFEQGDSLKPAADALKLAISQDAWVNRSGSEVKLLNNPKFLQAVFSDDVVRNKRNSEVVDVGGNTLVAARIVEYKPATVRPFEEVSALISQKLVQQQATQLASKQGRETLVKLRQGDAGTPQGWGPAKMISREHAEGYGGAVLAEVFKVDTSKLPAYAGVENAQGGFVLLKITRVVEDDKIDVEKRKAVSEQLHQMVGQEELSAYVASLKLKADVNVKREMLEKKER